MIDVTHGIVLECACMMYASVLLPFLSFPSSLPKIGQQHLLIELLTSETNFLNTKGLTLSTFKSGLKTLLFPETFF